MAGSKLDPKIAAASDEMVRAMGARLAAVETLSAALASIAIDGLNPGDARRDRMLRAISVIQQRNYSIDG